MVCMALDHTCQAIGVGVGWYGQTREELEGLVLSSSMLGSNVLPLESEISDSMKTHRYNRTLFIVSRWESGRCCIASSIIHRSWVHFSVGVHECWSRI